MWGFACFPSPPSGVFPCTTQSPACPTTKAETSYSRCQRRGSAGCFNIPMCLLTTSHCPAPTQPSLKVAQPPLAGDNSARPLLRRTQRRLLHCPTLFLGFASPGSFCLGSPTMWPSSIRWGTTGSKNTTLLSSTPLPPVDLKKHLEELTLRLDLDVFVYSRKCAGL